MTHHTFLNAHTDNIVKAYESGLSAGSIGKQYGVGDAPIYRILKKAGVSIRANRIDVITGAARAKELSGEIVHLFDEGIGVGSISKKFKLSVGRIAKVLASHGRKPRNRSEQQFARMARTDIEGRKKLVREANKAARGRKCKPEERAKMAVTRGRRKISRSRIEDIVAATLIERGVPIDRETAVGPYNCDFTIDGVAVEVWGGGWHFVGDHARRTPERFRYIMNAGFSIIVQVVDHRRPFSAAVADNLVREIEVLRSDPSARRSYRVIWGAGKFTTGGGFDDNEIAFKPPFTNRRNPATGQYETVAR